METFPAPPRASVLIESMRDIGYSLESALADIVDNSITAGASRVDILTDSGNMAAIAVLDDGAGMSRKELHRAMVPGSQSPLEHRDAADLGRFGLGLKTASMSQCRRLTVMTRRGKQTHAACWDLDYVAKTDDWLVTIPNALEELRWSEHLGPQGTLVLWENIDRAAGDDLVRQLDQAIAHLELVFHRFLSGSDGLDRLKICLNGRDLEPLDPFNPRHAATIIGPEESIQLGSATIKVQPFTLPHHSKVSPVEWRRYAGPGGYLKNQGFYVYRANRLIIHGTWFGLARQSELTKLARIRVDISNDLDSAWRIDVKKASARPPYVVRQRFKKIIDAMGASSKRVYRGRGTPLTTSSRLPVWTRTKTKTGIEYAVNPKHPAVSELSAHLDDELGKQLANTLEIVAKSLPLDALFADLGEAPDAVKPQGLSSHALERVVITAVAKLREEDFTDEQIAAMLSKVEPFQSNWEATEIVLEGLEEFDG